MEKDLVYIITIIENIKLQRDEYAQSGYKDPPFEIAFVDTIINLLKNEVYDSTYKFCTYTITRGGDISSFIDKQVSRQFQTLHDKIREYLPEYEQVLFKELNRFKERLEMTGFVLTDVKIDVDDSKGEDAENNYIESTIDDYLEPNRHLFQVNDYALLKQILLKYFETGTVDDIRKPIEYQRGGVKAIAKGIGHIHKAISKKPFDIAFLQFVKSTISGYEDLNFDQDNFRKSRLYKYLAAGKV
jgi:hypothetical protein